MAASVRVVAVSTALATASSGPSPIRPLGNTQVVMNAVEAAELTAVLKPELAIPHHYAFTKGWLGDRLSIKADRGPRHFHDAARLLAPETTARIVEPGVRVEL